MRPEGHLFLIRRVLRRGRQQFDLARDGERNRKEMGAQSRFQIAACRARERASMPSLAFWPALITGFGPGGLGPIVALAPTGTETVPVRSVLWLDDESAT